MDEQKIVRSILVVWKGNLLATASPALFITNASITKKTALWWSLLDPIDIWWLAIVTLGLSKVASVPYARAAVWVFGLWCSDLCYHARCSTFSRKRYQQSLKYVYACLICLF